MPCSSTVCASTGATASFRMINGYPGPCDAHFNWERLVPNRAGCHAWPRSRHSVSILEWWLQRHLAGDLPEEGEEEGRKNTRVWIASCLSYILLYLSDVVWVADLHSTSRCIVDCRVPHQKRHDKWAILASSPRGMRSRAGGEDKGGRHTIVSNVYLGSFQP